MGALNELVGRWHDAQRHAPHNVFKGEVMDDATLYRIIGALIDECPPTLFSEQIADVLKVNGEVLDA